MKTTSSYSDINDWFFSTLKTFLGKQKIVTIALPGGHSLDGWYASVIGNPDVWREIDTSCLRWCLVDERCVSPDNKDRNDSYVWEVFLKPLGCTQRQFLCFGATEVNALEYSEVISTPDVAIFGLGPDGHIASLFPEHPALLAQAEGYIHIHDAPKLPPERIVLTVPSVQKISHTALFAVGPEKQKAFDDFLDPDKTPFECPAKFLNPDIIFRQ